MAAFLDAEEIDAELDRSGQLVLALTPRHDDEIEAALDAARRVGIDDWKRFDRSDIRDALGSPLPRAALLAPRAATVHPAKLAEGLASLAERRGVRIHERSPVSALEGAPGALRVVARGGAVRASKVVLATNAYSHLLFPKLARRFLPLYDYVLASEPLSARQKASIRWKGRQGVTDFRSFFNYSRLTADDRVVWGTSEAVHHRGDGVGAAYDHDDDVYAGLEASFARFFPDLAGLRFPFRWGGAIAATTRFTPFFGALHGGRLLYALGYTGHGVGTTRIAGKLLAHLALERRSELADLALARRAPFPYPPEPLRSWAIRRVSRDLRRLDAGGSPSLLLRALERLGIGFSS